VLNLLLTFGAMCWQWPLFTARHAGLWSDSASVRWARCGEVCSQWTMVQSHGDWTRPRAQHQGSLPLWFLSFTRVV